MLFNTDAAYSGHGIIEICRSGAWGCVDIGFGVVYRHADGRPASAWDLTRDADLVRAHWPDLMDASGKVRHFHGTAIVNYFVWESDGYDSTVSTVNDYTRPVLEMSDRGWPGGLRWLHGEDHAAPA